MPDRASCQTRQSDPGDQHFRVRDQNDTDQNSSAFSLYLSVFLSPLSLFLSVGYTRLKTWRVCLPLLEL